MTRQPSTLPELETLFAALSDATRLRLLGLMAGGEVCVCFFVEVLQYPQPTISRHLAYLRRAGLVASRREGKWVHYRITPPSSPAARGAFEAVLETLRGDRSVARDLRRLRSASCSPRAAGALSRAPRPGGLITGE